MGQRVRVHVDRRVLIPERRTEHGGRMRMLDFDKVLQINLGGVNPEIMLWKHERVEEHEREWSSEGEKACAEESCKHGVEERMPERKGVGDVGA